MWYKMCICEPRNNRNKVKKGFLEEENENRLASKKKGNITGSKNATDTRCRNMRKRFYKG